MRRAAELFGLSTRIKNDRNPKDWTAQRAVAARFDGVLFADIISVDEAAECVEEIRLSPEGYTRARCTPSILELKGVKCFDRKGFQVLSLHFFMNFVKQKL